MRLGDFLASRSAPAPNKPVKFRVISQRLDDGRPISCEAEAVLVLVNEKERQEAIRDAYTTMRKLYPDGPPPERVDEEITYQVLYRALRDTADDRYLTYFADSVGQLKTALVYKTAAELDQIYNTWVSEEFPDYIDQAEFDELREEAKKKSLADLLSARGFFLIRRALPSLARAFGT